MSREADHKPVFSFHHISPVHVADQMNFEPRPSYPTENRDWIMPATRACCARRGLKREGSSHQVVDNLSCQSMALRSRTASRLDETKQ